MMGTPHRGLPGSLPPPQGLSLPNPAEPRHGQPPMSLPQPSSITSQSLSQPLGQLPEPPRQWQGADESMRNWLHAKAEEDKRKQEEEKTRQETLRLEQRKIEQIMLRESLAGGIPPAMVPMVFAGMGGGQLANTSVEWAQHYLSQMSIQQQQQQPPPPPPPAPAPQPLQIQNQPHQSSASHHSAPEGRRDGRTMAGPTSNPYATQPPPGLPPLPSGQHGQPPNPAFSSPYPTPAADSSRYRFQAQDPGAQRQQSSLSRLNTGGSLAELQIQQPPPGGMQMPIGAASHPPPTHQPQHTPSQTPQQQPQHTPQQQQSSGPNIFFHHWTPPNTNKDPSNPGTKSQHTSPYASHPQSHLRHEYQSSPKKRKTGGSAGGSSDRGNDRDNGSTTSPGGDRDSPRFEIVRTDTAGRKRATSNAAHAPAPDRRISNGDGVSDRNSSAQPDSGASRRGSAGPERKRTLSGTPKAEVEVR